MAKVAVITGIRRIGRELAGSLLERGYDLSVVYRSSDKEAEFLKDLASRLGRKILPIRGNLSDEAFYKEIARRTYEELGRVDAFLHLASPYSRTPMGEISARDIQEHFRPIAEAFLLLSQELYPFMLENEGEIKGHIVAFGDWAVERTPYRNYPAYFLAKGALHTAVKVLAKEFAPHVPVNCIALGPTLKAKDLTEEEWTKIIRNTPLKRQVSMKDLLRLAEYLLETESTTGEVIMLDGGRHIAGSGLGSVG